MNRRGFLLALPALPLAAKAIALAPPKLRLGLRRLFIDPKCAGLIADLQRPKNYREAILLLWPDASAPLTALLQKMQEAA